MKRIAHLVSSTFFSLVVLAGSTVLFTGCAADSLSGPSIEAYAETDTSDPNGNTGSAHNNPKNETDTSDPNGNTGSAHNNPKVGTDTSDPNGNTGSAHNNP